MAVPRDSIAVLYIIREGYGDLPMYNLIKQTKTGVSPSLLQCAPTKVLAEGFGQSELHLPFDQNCQLSSEQLFAGLVQFGRYVSYGLGPRQLRRTQAVVVPRSCRPFHAPLVSCFLCYAAQSLVYAIRLTWEFQERELDISTPRYFAQDLPVQYIVFLMVILEPADISRG